MAKALVKHSRRLRWTLYAAATALLVFAAAIGFRWARTNGADGGDVLSFIGGAVGAGLAVAGARWLSFAAEHRQAKQDATAFSLALWVAIKTWEIVLRRNVADPPDALYSEGLLRQSCEQASKLLFLIESDAGKRESANLAKSNAMFGLALSIKRNISLFDEVNHTPHYRGFVDKDLRDKLDKLWFVLYDVIRPAYSALDRYVEGSWKSETITALAVRYPEMLIKLAESKGKEVDAAAIRSAAKPMGEDETWDRISKFLDEFRR